MPAPLGVARRGGCQFAACPTFDTSRIALSITAPVIYCFHLHFSRVAACSLVNLAGNNLREEGLRKLCKAAGGRGGGGGRWQSPATSQLMQQVAAPSDLALTVLLAALARLLAGPYLMHQVRDLCGSRRPAAAGPEISTAASSGRPALHPALTDGDLLCLASRVNAHRS